MNKGEWSELYTFLRLLADGKLYTADSTLNRTAGLYYPIVEIIQYSENHTYPLYYKIMEEEIIIIDSHNNKLRRIPTEQFTIHADQLLRYY